jgi:predicted Zn-ribbon and HTH transcriptional regulator
VTAQAASPNEIIDISAMRQIGMPFRCKKCGVEFDDRIHLDIHSRVHGRKRKISEAGGIDFDKVGF